MHRRKISFVSILAACGIILLVLDSKTAVNAATDAIELCIRVVIPSLYPLMVLSMLLTCQDDGGVTVILKPLCGFLRLPSGSESFLLAGFLGGYPTGAQCIYQSYLSGSLSKREAESMIGCFSNAGPSFIFGIAASVFDNKAAPWLILGMQILSSVCVAMLLRPIGTEQTQNTRAKPMTFTDIIYRSIRSMAGICGWILLFRCLLTYLTKWFMGLLPAAVRVLLTGSLELTNGCLALTEVKSEPLRFVLCSILMSVGGLCVLMQTHAVIGELRILPYLHGKLLQGFFCGIFSVSVAFFLYSEGNLRLLGLLFPVLVTFCLVFFTNRLQKCKKAVDFPAQRVYNSGKNA